MRLRYRLAPDEGLGSGGSSEKKDDPPKDQEKKDAAELDQAVKQVEKQIKTKEAELARASEDTMHAVLEEVRELRKELANLKSRRRWLLF